MSRKNAAYQAIWFDNSVTLAANSFASCIAQSIKHYYST